MTQTLANGYSSESTQLELFNEYQDDRVQMVFRKLCILVLWTKVASALEGLKACIQLSRMLCRGKGRYHCHALLKEKIIGRS